MIIQKSENWKTQFPEGFVGILTISNAPNLSSHPELEEARIELESETKERYGNHDRRSLRELPVFAAYDSFYRPFKKTYHVQLQIESVAFKGKNIISPSTLVSCMFMAEIKTGLLTAAHDLTKVELPLVAEVAVGDEVYQRLDKTEQKLKEGDLFIKDQKGILSSVIYGPDSRTQIRQSTDQALFTTYGPPGIKKEQIIDQFEILESYLKLFAPQLIREEMIVI